MEKFGSRAKAAYVAALFCGVECLMSGPPGKEQLQIARAWKIPYIFLMNTIKMVGFIRIFQLCSLKNWSFVAQKIKKKQPTTSRFITVHLKISLATFQ